MPGADFQVNLRNLDSDEIAAYAFRMLHCPGCKAGPGRKCTKATKDYTVCRTRFTDAVAMLSGIGEYYIRAEFSKYESLEKSGFRLPL